MFLGKQHMALNERKGRMATVKLIPEITGRHPTNDILCELAKMIVTGSLKGGTLTPAQTRGERHFSGCLKCRKVVTTLVYSLLSKVPSRYLSF